MPSFTSRVSGATFAVPEAAAPSYRQSDNFEEVDVPTFTHNDTGRKLSTSEPAAKSFRESDDFTEDGIQPNVNDLKAVWVEWAQAQGHDTDGLTKADLMDLAGD